MNYLDFKDIMQRKPGPVLPVEKKIMRQFLEQRTSSDLLDKRHALRYFRRSKVENVEYEVIKEILIERGELQIN